MSAGVTRQETRSAQADQLVYLEERLGTVEDEINDAMEQLAEKRAERRLLVRWISRLEKFVCGGCGGLGSIQKQYAHDDIKHERCGQCKGTGKVFGVP